MSIALERSVGGFFNEVVVEALRTRRVDVTEEATSYLVGLLTQFAHPDPGRDDTFGRPLAFLLDEAFRTTGAERFQRLRALGDGVLYLSGFFGDHIENRGVDVGYVTNVGATAYRGAASMLRRSDGDARSRRARAPMGDGPEPAEENVFSELSIKFDEFVRVLAIVAETTLAQQAKGEIGVLKLYERWLRSGSATIAKELGARGIVPVRGTTGLH
jgi:hypothetical protein